MTLNDSTRAVFTFVAHCLIITLAIIIVGSLVN
jgi:hypothetical protein